MRQGVHGSDLDPDAASNGSATPKAEIKLRIEHFTLLCNVLGHTTVEAQATFIGMGWRALTRARNNGTCGEKLVAHALAAFETHADRFAALNLPITFDALFEVIAPAEHRTGSAA